MKSSVISLLSFFFLVGGIHTVCAMNDEVVLLMDEEYMQPLELIEEIMPQDPINQQIQNNINQQVQNNMVIAANNNDDRKELCEGIVITTVLTGFCAVSLVVINILAGNI